MQGISFITRLTFLYSIRLPEFMFFLILLKYPLHNYFVNDKINWTKQLLNDMINRTKQLLKRFFPFQEVKKKEFVFYLFNRES
jgi:hypothetical protein